MSVLDIVIGKLFLVFAYNSRRATELSTGQRLLSDWDAQFRLDLQLDLSDRIKPIDVELLGRFLYCRLPVPVAAIKSYEPAAGSMG